MNHKVILCIILDYKILKFKHLIDNIVTNFLFYGNFASMKNIIKKCNPIVNFSKFTSNKKILSGVVIAIGYKLIRSQTFFFFFWENEFVVKLY